MFGKILITHQTGPEGKKSKEFIFRRHMISKRNYILSCLVDRESSKIAFISSTEGGVDIESVAKKKPEKILTNKIDLKKSLTKNDIEKIIKIFSFNDDQKKDAEKLVNAFTIF